MPAPDRNLILFALSAVVLVTVFWPGSGLVARTRRGRRLASRVMLEDALKHVFGNEARDNACTLSSIAGALEISSARALALVDRMQRGHLVRVSDGRIGLTDDGRRYALEVIRAHRLWERYLADETGIDPLEWHKRAERREHSMTPEETNALAERLGNPRFDPHGDPIPTADGAIERAASIGLDALEPGQHATITHLEDEPPVVYAQLVALGMYVGMTLRMEVRSEQRIVFESDGRSIVLAPLLAQNVFVRLHENHDEVEDDANVRTLASLAPGECADVVRLSPACRGLERRRLMDLGVVAGTHVEFERRGITGGLSAYRVRGTVIALREEQASMIRIASIRRVDEGDPRAHAV